jgi:hypothetical protein
VCFETDRVDHNCTARGTRSAQSFNHAQEHAPLAPPLPQVAKGLVRSVRLGRIAPAHPIAVYEDDAAQRPPIINPGHAVAIGKVRLQPRHRSSVSQYRSLVASLLAEPESDRTSHINRS